METPNRSGRDPVCGAIESLLNDLVQQGHGPLKVEEQTDQVTLRFGNAAVEAPTLDIALVRLVNKMMDDPKYTAAICSMLRGEVGKKQ